MACVLVLEALEALEITIPDSSRALVCPNTSTVALKSVLKCCSKFFADLSSLSVHFTKQEFHEAKPFSCSTCGKIFNRSRDHDRHFRRMHEPSVSHSCQYCGKFFSRRCDGLVHERKVHRLEVDRNKTFKCALCPRGFNSRTYMENHEKAHQKGELQCNRGNCNRSFSYSSEKTSHDVACHGSKENGFVCHYCEQVFARKGSLIAHFDVHLKKSNFVCDSCGKAFTRREALKRHVLTQHSSGTEVSCDICSKVFSNEASLRLHKTRLHAEEEVVCRVCGKTFGSLTKCRRHEIQHTRSFSCSFCGKTLSSAANREEHEKLHMAKSHTCCLCGKNFAQKTGLLHHQRDTHAEVRNHKCHVCGRSFKHSTQLHVHRREHEDPALKHCGICNRDYASRPSYFVHRRRAHPELARGSNEDL